MADAKATKCPSCGASLRPGVTRCWLCERELPSDEVLPAFDDENPYASPVAMEEESFHSFSLSTLLLLITLLAIAGGVYSIWPGVGLALAIFMLIPFMRTVLLVRARAARGKETPWPQRLALAGLSAAVILAMVGVFCTAAFIAFFVVCWVAVFAAQGLGEQGVLLVFFGGLATCAIGVLVGFAYLARYRWRKDVEAR